MYVPIYGDLGSKKNLNSVRHAVVSIQTAHLALHKNKPLVYRTKNNASNKASTQIKAHFNTEQLSHKTILHKYGIIRDISFQKCDNKKNTSIPSKEAILRTSGR